MQNSIHILLLESDSDIQEQIRKSLAAENLAFKIETITPAALQTATTTAAPDTYYIVSNKEIPGKMQNTTCTQISELICLIDENELSETERLTQNLRGVQIIVKYQQEISTILNAVKKAQTLRKNRILADFLYQENRIKSIGNLLSGIAHNISAPLTGILGFAEIIRSKHPELIEIEHIINQSRRIDSILRALTQKNMKLQEKETEFINLNKLIKNEINFLQANLVFKHEMTKKLEFAKELPSFKAVYSDVSHCIYAILTFCINATKASNRTELRIKTDFNSQNILLELGYFGRPFPVDEFSRIASHRNLTIEFNSAGNLEKWLQENFDIYLSYSKLISIGVTFDCCHDSEIEKTIILKFPYNVNQNQGF